MDVNIHVPLKMAREISVALGEPLSSDRLPEPKDLDPYIRKCTRIVNTLTPRTDCAILNRNGLDNLAPILLGEPVWQAIKAEPYHSWLGMWE